MRDAAANARRNHIGNAEFYQGDAGEFMRQMQEAGEKLDVLFMDQPRAGSSRTFLSAVAALAPQRVVYISCNPETQARDIGFLVQKGYRVQAIQPLSLPSPISLGVMPTGIKVREADSRDSKATVSTWLVCGNMSTG